MRDTAHKLFYKCRLVLWVVFACIISFSQVYADNHVNITRPSIPVNPITREVIGLVNTTTPSLINLSESRARSLLLQRGLKLRVASRRQLSNGKGLIISQNPQAGTRIRLGKSVSVVISIPPAPNPLTVSISPPSQTVAQGALAVFNAKYNKKNVRLNWQMNGQSGTNSSFRVNTKNLRPGSYDVNLAVTESSQVIGAAAQLSTKRARARLIVKDAVPQRLVPNVIKYSRNEAFEIIRKNRLIPGKVTEKPTTTKALNDVVYSQKPSAGQKLIVGTKVDLWVYKLTQDPLRIKITPSQHTIEQGKTVTFVASSKTQSLTYSWSGAGQNSTSNRFVINSNNLSPNTYPITLKVWDKNRRTAIDRAVLQVNKRKPELSTVPDVTKKYRSDAITLLRGKGFKLGKTTFERREKGQNDWVLKQQPVAGTKVLPNSRIDLIVSKHPPLPPIKVSIEPPNILIERGQELTFVAVSKNELNSYSWEGAGQKSSSERFIIQSQNLSAKNYEIKLTVGDKHQRSETARTTLQVIKPEENLIRVPDLIGLDIDAAKEKLIAEVLVSGSVTEKVVSSGESQRVLEQTPKAMTQVKEGSVVNLIISNVSIVQPPSENFTLELNVENSQHIVGKATRFLLKPSKPDSDAQYWLQLDEAQSSETFSQTQYEHVFKQSGIHSVYAKSRVNGEVYQSEPVNIWIYPAWLIPIVAGLGLLTLGAGIAKAASSSQAKVVKKIKLSRVSVKPITDLGYQEISSLSLAEGKGSSIDGHEYHINVGFDNVLNDGEWEVLIEETHQKIKGSYSDE